MKDFQFFRLRLPTAVHERVSKSAAAAGHSINTEVKLAVEAFYGGDRLDRLLKEDPDLRHMVWLMTTTFTEAGRMLAAMKGLPEDTPTSEWIGDREIRRQATLAVMNTVMGPLTGEELETLMNLHKGQTL